MTGNERTPKANDRAGSAGAKASTVEAGGSSQTQGHHDGPQLPNPRSADELKQSSVGLTQAQVDAKHEAGQSNHVDTGTSRPVSAILRSNIFTIFNAILITCGVAVLAVGDWRDAVFMFVLILNMAIGIFSELRSKHALDSLAVLQAPTSSVLRDGRWQKARNENLVEDDVIEVKLGDQIPADGQVIRADGLDVDESALTGEAKPVHKHPGDTLMSGTAVVAGSGHMLVEVIGADAWAQKITAEAKKFSRVHSEIQDSINKILKWITFVLPIIIVLLLWSQLRTGQNDWRTAVIFTVAGIVGMIPQGLVLLTSMNFGLAAATLARRGVLVQELPAVEVLARVDVLCLDKTGTLTTGDIRGRELIQPGGLNPIPGLGEGETEASLARAVLAQMVSDDANATSTAVSGLVEGDARPYTSGSEEIPFNSARKWAALTLPASAAVPEGMRTWVFGAPEILLGAMENPPQWASDAVAEAGDKGRRTVCLAYSPGPVTDEELPAQLTPSIVAVLEEDVRPDAGQTLSYFRGQGVRAKVISGDAPRTVGAIAAEVGIAGEDGAPPVIVDARTLPPVGTDEFNQQAVDTDVFGRVTPEQKRGLVHALQRAGYTVAMTGDGVNDALALKDADLGIAMGNAAPATKAVSRIVLVNGKFADLPGVVAEGRRIIANMERVSSLFLTKTTYAMLLAVIVAIAGWVYPFLPRQLTYVGTFTIGVPAFFLSLAPNAQKYKPGFLRRTLSVAVPSGIILGLVAVAAYLLGGEGTEIGHTGATLTLIVGAMALLIILARPWNWWRVTLVVLMIIGSVLGLIIPPVRDFFAMALPSHGQWGTIAGLGLLGAALIAASYALTSRWRDRQDATHPSGDHQS